jgi:hypothetical protein
MKTNLSLASLALLPLLLSAKPTQAASYSSTVLADGPIAYYRFSDGVNTPVLNLAHNSGSLGAAADGIYTAAHPVPGALPGSSDTAARASGGQNVSVPYQAGLNVPGAFSAEAWLRPTTNFTDATLTCPLSSVQVNAPRSGWLLYQSSGGWNFRTYNTNTTTVAVSITGGGALTVGAWYHVACVWDGTVGKLYVNGVLAATSGPTNFVANPNTPFTMGTRSAGDFAWSGDIDEVAFYPSALSDVQVANHYGNGINPTPLVTYSALILGDNPAGYWRLGEAAFAAPVAANSGSMGAAANGQYLGGAIDGAEAPRPPQFFGFEADNTALQLDGVKNFVSTVSGLLNGKPRFTLTGWIRRATDQANRTGLFGQNDIVEFGYINNNTLECWTDNGLDISPNPFPNGAWEHIALVSDGSPGTLTMYTNGVAAGSRTSVLPGDNTFAFNIGGGGIFDATGNFFNGQIDEVAVFDKALSASQVANEYFSTVAQAPLITRQPQDTNLFEGGTIQLSVSAAGSPDLRYQWLYFGTDLQDQTNSTLVITNAQLFDTGTYSVRVDNDFGSLESDGADVNVLPTTPPVITQDPAPASRYVGSPRVVFSVTATGGNNLTYQWQSGNGDIPGATNSTLVISNVQPSDADFYQVTVSNEAGSTTSSPAELTIVTPAPGSYEAAILAGGPVAYWRLDEASGTIAHDNWGGYDGTYNGGVTLGVPGSLTGDSDTAAEFNGTSGYVGTPLSLNGQKDVTLLGWMRRTGDQADRTGLWGQNDLIEFGYIDNNTIQSWIDNFDAAVNVSPNPIPNLQWAQLALVVNSGVHTVYVNGSPAGSATLTSSDYGTTAFKFNIAGGGIFDASGNFFKGQVDDVSVYYRALSSAELCSLYLKGSGTPVALQIDPTGNILADSKPSGIPHNGLDFGAEWAGSDADAVSVTRSGVMKFTATEGDQVKVNAHPDFNTTSGTIMFWVRTAGVSGPGDYAAMLVDRRSANGDVITMTTTGEIFVQASGGVNSFQTTRKVNDDHWHHVTYVYDQSASGSTTIYIDGVLDTSQASTGSWSWDPNEPIELGRSHDPFWYALDGSMDDVRVYNVRLSASEISSVYDGDGSTPVAASAMVLRLNFEAPPSGTTIRWPCGVLQQADELIGDGSGTIWNDIPNASPPYTILPDTAARFFRLRL